MQGIVFGFNRGGFDVLVEGMRAFCPASAMALEDIEDPTQFLGQKLEFLLPASQAVSKDIVVSRRSILERQLRKKARELVRSLSRARSSRAASRRSASSACSSTSAASRASSTRASSRSRTAQRPSDVGQAGDEVEVQVLRVGAERTRDGGKRDACRASACR